MSAQWWLGVGPRGTSDERSGVAWVEGVVVRPVWCTSRGVAPRFQVVRAREDGVSERATPQKAGLA
jgi:hypothetical protein